MSLRHERIRQHTFGGGPDRFDRVVLVVRGRCRTCHVVYLINLRCCSWIEFTSRWIGTVTSCSKKSKLGCPDDVSNHHSGREPLKIEPVTEEQTTHWETEVEREQTNPMHDVFFSTSEQIVHNSHFMSLTTIGYNLSKKNARKKMTEKWKYLKH